VFVVEVQHLLSKYILEISKVKDEGTLYAALSEITKKVLNYEVLNVLKDGAIVHSDPHMEIDKTVYADFVPWVEERLSPSFVPVEDGFVGLIPIFKGTKVLSMVVLKTPNEPTSETMDYLQLVAYLSGVTLENLRLLEFVDKARGYFESILNLANDGIVVLSGGTTEFANTKAKMLFDEYPELLVLIMSNITGEEGSFELELGKLFLSVFVKPVRLLGEEKLLVGLRNITSEKEVQKLRELDKIKTNFIANISHELRTPLAAIKAYTETIINTEMNHEEIMEFLNIVYEQSLKLEQLLNDLLDFSQMESHTMKLIKEEVNLCVVMNQALDTVRNLALQKKVEIQAECDNNLSVICDPRRMEQVLVNLLSNAIKFSDDKKKNKYVKVRISKVSPDMVEITVEDNGIGIPNDKLDKIFDKFYRVDSELTYSIPGTGLGLAIVKEIVELHNGEIAVLSEEGIGSTFTVRIPTRDPEKE